MNVLRWGSRMLSRTTPTGLILTGATLALALPIVRQGVRTTALLATKGVLTLTDQTKSMIAKIRENAEDFMAEARATEQNTTGEIAEKWDRVRHHARSHRRRLIAATATGVAAVSDKAQELKHEFRDAVEEAKSKRSPKSHSRHEAETQQQAEAINTPPD